MKKAWIRRTIAIILFLIAIMAVLHGAGLFRAVSANHSTNTAPIMLRTLRWSMGDCFDLTSSLCLTSLFTLRQVPFLLSAPGTQKIETPDTPLDISKPDSPSAPIGSAAEPVLSSGDNGVPAQTVIPKNASGYTVVNGVYIKNASNKSLDTDQFSGDFAAQYEDTTPQVLILHTHGSEAYTPAEGLSYVSTGNYRTSDTRYSVIGVGDEIAATLSEYGISVLHDRSLYDDPYYEGAYERAAEAIESYLEKYPSITYVLDIHRDAVEDSSGKQYKLISQEDSSVAQLSFIMGSNHDGWEENLKLAVAVSAQLSLAHPTIMRPITLRNSNYNEHYTLGSMLIEVGTAGNSPEEAIRAGRIFAEGFAETIIKDEK